MKVNHKWTRQAKKALLDGLGVEGWKTLERKTEHRPSAIARAARRFHAAGIRRGTYSLTALAEETGYTRRQLQRAARALDQRWSRTRRNGPYMITDEQRDELIVWLGHDYWSKSLHLYRCHRCGTDVRPHYALGNCLRCYRVLARKAARLGIEFSRPGFLRALQHRPNSQIERMVYAGRSPLDEDLTKLASPRE